MGIKVSAIFLLLITITVSYALPRVKRQVKESGSPGYECMVDNYACDTADDNLITEYEDTHTNEGCKQRCVENSDCQWWTHFDEGNFERENHCRLFKQCVSNTRCDPSWSCYSGDLDCAYGNGDAPIIIGGIDEEGDNVATVEVFVEDYTPVCNLIPSIPSNMAYKNSATAAVAARIYGCGGEGNDGKPTKQCMVLNILNKPDYEWKSSEDAIPSMQDSRTSAAAIGAYGELYIFGGSNVTTPNVLLMSSVAIYNPEAKKWRYLDSQMEHARSGHCAVLQKDLVYIIGGKTSGCNNYMSVDTYNITSRQWETYSLEKEKVGHRMGHACSLHNNQIIVSGGSSGTDWTHVLENVIAIDITPGSQFMKVTTLPNMVHGRMSHGMTIYKDSPYVIGGHGTYDEYIEFNEMLNYTDTSWVEMGKLHSARSHFSITELSSQLLPVNEGVECS